MYVTKKANTITRRFCVNIILLFYFLDIKLKIKSTNNLKKYCLLITLINN